MYHIYADGELVYYPLNHFRSVIAPKLTLEMGKAGSLTFELPSTNAMYDRLQKMRTIVTVESDETELFRGRVFSEERNFNNQKTIYCEGDLAFLIDSVQKPDAYSGTTRDFFRKVVAAHNQRVEPSKQFLVGDVTIEDRSILISGQSDVIQNAETGEFDYNQIAINATTNDWSTSYDYISRCLIDYCGGYLRTRRESDGVYLDYLLDYGHSASQEIEFGVNMIDFSEEISAEDLFTVLIPLGDENLTIASVNGGSDELVDAEAVAQYGRIVRTHVFDGVNQPSTLLENAKRYLANNVNVPVIITITAVDLHLLNPDIREIHIGDSVHVKSRPHNIVQNLVCTKIEYDLANPGNTVYTFGNPRQTLTERYRKDIQKVESAASGTGDVGLDADDPSTSSGSGRRGSGAAAKAAADAAIEAAEEETKKELKDFFDAWINVDPDSAHVDLGAVSKLLEGTRQTLTEVGIDLDGVTGNVNIRSLKKTTDDLTGQVKSQSARIDIVQKDNEVRIEQEAKFRQELEGKVDEHYAYWNVIANAQESAIEGKADRFTVEAIDLSLKGQIKKYEDDREILQSVGINFNAEAGNVNLYALRNAVDANGESIKVAQARIEAVATADESRVSLLAERVVEGENKVASIELSVTDMGSKIAMKADQVTVEAIDLSLHGQIEKYEEDRKILQSVGINFNAKEGNVNLYTLRNAVDANGKEIVAAQARIEAVAKEDESRVSLLAGRVNDGEEKVASIDLRVTKMGSKISAKADQVVLDTQAILIGNVEASLAETQRILYTKGIDVWNEQNGLSLYAMANDIKGLDGRLTDARAAVDVVANAQEASAKMYAQYGDRIASVEVKAGANEKSVATIKADIIELNGTVSRLNAKVAEVDKLIAQKIDSYFASIDTLSVGAFYASKVMTTQAYVGGAEVATKLWVINQKYLTSVPESSTVGGKTVATQDWVRDVLKSYALKSHTHPWSEVTDKPASYKAQAHTHSFSGSYTLQWGHTHTSATGGVANYSTKTIKISGTTGSTGG